MKMNVSVINEQARYLPTPVGSCQVHPDESNYQRVWYAYLLAQLLSRKELQTFSMFLDVHCDGQASPLGVLGISWHACLIAPNGTTSPAGFFSLLTVYIL